jgi:selenide,water dikinase
VGAELSAPPLLTGVEALARAGVRTGAARRNWESCQGEADLPAGFEDWRRDILTDPQTSGGLLICVAADRADAVLALARKSGFGTSAVVGRLTQGEARIGVLDDAH